MVVMGMVSISVTGTFADMETEVMMEMMVCVDTAPVMLAGGVKNDAPSFGRGTGARVVVC